MAQYRPIGNARRILSSQDAACLVREFFTDLPVERLFAVYLDASGRTLGLLELDSGALNGVSGELRTLIGPALACNARAMLLAHNHPSGDARPSETDLATTRQIALVLKHLSIRLHDHLIIAGKEWRSMRADGLL